ncbi:hypothetical protein JCM15519_04900 [Fundidesulfovibrio butyratiphilus]
MLELARRGVLGACLLIGLWLFFLPDRTPLWTVGPYGEGGDPAVRTVTVSGPLWAAFFQQAGKALAGAKVEKTLARRLGLGPRQDGSKGPKLYFKYYDPPLSELGRPEKVALRLEGTDLALSLDVFVPDPRIALWTEQPPPALIHPWRKTGWKAWPAGLLTALFLPWPGRGKGLLRWPGRKILALDLCWLGLTALCFGFPLAFFQGMAFAGAQRTACTALCWALACLGLGLGWVAAARAASGVRLTDQGLTIIGLGEDEFVPYDRLASAQSPERSGWRARFGWFTPWIVVLTLLDGETLSVRLGDAEQAGRLVQVCSGAVAKRDG